MGKINTGILKDFTDGTYVHDVDFDQTFEIIRTAINDNYDKIVNRYTKAEVDSLLASIGAGVALSIQVLNVLPTGSAQGRFVLKNPENILYYYTGASWIQVTTSGDLSTLQTSLTNHMNNVSNPHSVTASQVGAIPLSQKAAVNGVPSLGADSRLPLIQAPARTYGSTTLVGTFPVRTGIGPYTFTMKTFSIPLTPDTQRVKLFVDGTNNNASIATIYKGIDKLHALQSGTNTNYDAFFDVNKGLGGDGSTFIDASIQGVLSIGYPFGNSEIVICDAFIQGNNLILKMYNNYTTVYTSVSSNIIKFIMEG